MDNNVGLPAPYWDYEEDASPPPPHPHLQAQDFLRETVFVLNVYAGDPSFVGLFISFVALTASFLTCLIIKMCQWRTARKRRRANALAVKIAENAPVNDSWEHEMEKQTEVRRAAPTDSDDDDDENGLRKK